MSGSQFGQSSGADDVRRPAECSGDVDLGFLAGLDAALPFAHPCFVDPCPQIPPSGGGMDTGDEFLHRLVGRMARHNQRVTGGLFHVSIQSLSAQDR
ncbi:hypothetical protein ACWGIA_21660 [Streptomyces bobili]